VHIIKKKNKITIYAHLLFLQRPEIASIVKKTITVFSDY
jgi:hypothetical protein